MIKGKGAAHNLCLVTAVSLIAHCHKQQSAPVAVLGQHLCGKEYGAQVGVDDLMPLLWLHAHHQ